MAVLDAYLLPLNSHQIIQSSDDTEPAALEFLSLDCKWPSAAEPFQAPLLPSGSLSTLSETPPRTLEMISIAPGVPLDLLESLKDYAGLLYDGTMIRGVSPAGLHRNTAKYCS